MVTKIPEIYCETQVGRTSVNLIEGSVEFVSRDFFKLFDKEYVRK